MVRVALATEAQVLQTAKKDNATEVGGSAIVTEAIDEAEEEVFENYGDPIRKSTFLLDSTQTEYEFNIDRRKTYRIDRVWVRLDDNSIRVYTEAVAASETLLNFSYDSDRNSITFHTDTINSYNGNRVEVHYVPNIFHQLVRNIAALHLLDADSLTNAEENTPTFGTRIFQRIKRLEAALTPSTAVGSEDEKYWDPTYGTVVPQRRFRTY